MGKPYPKKGEKGNAANFITRAQAVKRLQISLKDFRRLCILKGIYPRAPSKKVKGKDKTYYYTKDIKMLALEPVLQTLRQQKTFAKKITRAQGRYDEDLAQRLRSRKPTYSLAHLVRERYPSFADALRDLDDALSLVHVIAALPKNEKIPPARMNACRRLCREWQRYVVESHTLRKVFCSIKGMYYQAEVDGESVTWLIPHKFTQQVLDDVDYRVMGTFCEFYETLLGFVMFRLYHSLGFAYPPELDDSKDVHDQGLTSLTLDLLKASKNEGSTGIDADSSTSASDAALAKPSSEDAMDEDNDDDVAEFVAMGKQQSVVGEEGEADAHDTLLAKHVEEQESQRRKRLETEQVQHLFSGCFFFISREVPKDSLEFLIRACGGHVSWEMPLVSPDLDDEEGIHRLSRKRARMAPPAPVPLPRATEVLYPASDTRITHHVIDRPTPPEARDPTRTYIQPQWVFDSINTGMMVPTHEYGPSATLPPHLSPFVDDEAEGYTPARVEYLRRVKDGVDPEGEDVAEADADDGDDAEQADSGSNSAGPSDSEDEEEDAEDSEDEQDGATDLMTSSGPASSKKQRKVDAAKLALETKQKEDAEALQLQKIMMTRKNRRLHSRIEHSLRQKSDRAALLMSRRDGTHLVSSTDADAVEANTAVDTVDSVDAEIATNKKRKRTVGDNSSDNETSETRIRRRHQKQVFMDADEWDPHISRFLLHMSRKSKYQ